MFPCLESLDVVHYYILQVHLLWIFSACIVSFFIFNELYRAISWLQIIRILTAFPFHLLLLSLRNLKSIANYPFLIGFLRRVMLLLSLTNTCWNITQKKMAKNVRFTFHLQFFQAALGMLKDHPRFISAAEVSSWRCMRSNSWYTRMKCLYWAV